jgi:YgiT-type zinc finger domain-containing protein
MGKSSFFQAAKKEAVMSMVQNRPIPICGTHHIPKEWRPTTFEYHDEGILIRISGVYAWVCPQGGEASFTPETTDELIETVSELIEVAKHARRHRSTPTEYLVSVT